MRPPMQLRPATAADLPRILTLEAQGFAPGTRERADVYAERIALFADGFLVAEEEEALLGCICSELWRHAPQPEPARFALGHRIAELHAPGHDELYLSSMTVAPAARGRGLGQQLVTACLARCAARYRLRSALLLVSERWLPARRIYARLGFGELLRLPDFFRAADAPPAAGLVMRKPLRPAATPVGAATAAGSRYDG